jgi:hypothetical protein
MNKKKMILLFIFAFTVAGSAYGMKYYYEHFENKGGKVIYKHAPKLSQQDKIRNIIKKNLKDIQDCYNQRLEDGLEKNGKLKISWEINEIGIASNFIESDNELNDTELYDCSSHAISKWRFPEGIYFKINYTFNLKQKEKGDRQTASASMAE